MSPRTNYACFLSSLMVVLSLIGGCGSGKTEKAYIPAANHAQEALDAVLKEWQSGAAHGTVKTASVPIDVFDARWQNGKKLESYEILREEASDGPRTFVVKMKLTDENEPSEIKYLVVGINPLLVFAEKDYKKATGAGG